MKRYALAALVALAGLLATLAGLFYLARARTIQVCGPLVWRVETRERAVALTIDDGPNSAALDEILALLASRRARVTFFVLGSELARDPDAGRRIVAAGHELGNHTYHHERMVLRSQAFIRDEIEATDALIRAAGQRGAVYFRPPFCWKLFGLPWFLWRTGRTSVTWDVEPDSFPAVAHSPEAITAHVLERVRPGSIVLLHAWGNRASRAALPAVIDALQARGLRLVTVGELLALDARVATRTPATLSAAPLASGTATARRPRAAVAARASR